MTLAHSPGVIQKGVLGDTEGSTSKDYNRAVHKHTHTHTHKPQLNAKQCHKNVQRKDSDSQETYTYLYLVKYVSFHLISGNKDVCACV